MSLMEPVRGDFVLLERDVGVGVERRRLDR
jgi:hypothetical protein